MKALTCCSSDIHQRLKEKIEDLRSNDASKMTSAGFVHQAVIECSLNKLRFYKFISGSLESFNSKKEVPLELAIHSNHLEIVLFIIDSTKNVFENTSLAPGVNDFLAKKIMEKNELTSPLIKKYQKVWEKLLKYRNAHNLIGLTDECVNEVFKGQLAMEAII